MLTFEECMAKVEHNRELYKGLHAAADALEAKIERRRKQLEKLEAKNERDRAIWHEWMNRCIANSQEIIDMWADYDAQKAVTA